MLKRCGVSLSQDIVVVMNGVMVVSFGKVLDMHVGIKNLKINVLEMIMVIIMFMMVSRKNDYGNGNHCEDNCYWSGCSQNSYLNEDDAADDTVNNLNIIIKQFHNVMLLLHVLPKRHTLQLVLIIHMMLMVKRKKKRLNFLLILLIIKHHYQVMVVGKKILHHLVRISLFQILMK